MNTRSSPRVTQGDLLRLEARLQARLTDFEQTIMRHFDVVSENLAYDFRGAFTDKLSMHDDRLNRLEMHTGLRPH